MIRDRVFVALFNKNGKFTFSALKTAGDRLNHAVMLNIIAHTDIDVITEEPALQG